MDILCEGLLSFPINRTTSSPWVRTMWGETRALTQQLRTEGAPKLLLAHHTHPPVGVMLTSPGWLPVWKEAGKLLP